MDPGKIFTGIWPVGKKFLQVVQQGEKFFPFYGGPQHAPLENFENLLSQFVSTCIWEHLELSKFTVKTLP